MRWARRSAWATHCSPRGRASPNRTGEGGGRSGDERRAGGGDRRGELRVDLPRATPRGEWGRRGACGVRRVTREAGGGGGGDGRGGRAPVLRSQRDARARGAGRGDGEQPACAARGARAGGAGVRTARAGG